MNFEFDESKSASNKDKHGIDFVEAQTLWNSEPITIPIDYPGEPRLLVIGKIHEKYWTAFVTIRGENIRIISVRRSRDNEKEKYDNY